MKAASRASWALRSSWGSSSPTQPKPYSGGRWLVHRPGRPACSCAGMLPLSLYALAIDATHRYKRVVVVNAFILSAALLNQFRLESVGCLPLEHEPRADCSDSSARKGWSRFGLFFPSARTLCIQGCLCRWQKPGIKGGRLHHGHNRIVSPTR